MKRTLLSVCLLAFMAVSTWAAKVEKTVNIKIGNDTRSYKLYVPSNAKGDIPLVFSLHGTGGSSNDKAPFRTDVADKYGCIVVYPQGEQMTFPAFGNAVLPGWHSTGEYTKDIDFFKAIIEDVAGNYNIDRKRIYCCGFSNGGMMTYTVANQCSDIFAAFASISGFPLNEFHLHHTSARPFPFLHIHGKADDFVKYSLMPNIVDNIVARNGANPVAEVKTVSGKYTKSVYAATEGGFPYTYYEVDGMGHNDFTNNTEDNSSALTMWKFFSQYTLDTERDETLKWRPNIDMEGWTPKNHGWTVSPTAASTLLKFGSTTKTDANQNAYRSLQFETGKYKITFKAVTDNPEGTVKITLKKNGKNTYLLRNAEVEVNKDASLMFEVTDGWGEYTLTATRGTAEGAVNFKNLEIRSVTEEEWTSIRSVKEGSTFSASAICAIDGRQVSTPQKGITIQQDANGNIRKMLKK